MSKILGLDLGTNSIGWAVVERDRDEFTLIDKGVRIFSEGVKSEKGIESSRAAERTGYRSARKIKYRRKLRKYETLKVLAKNQMCPLSIGEVEAWKKSGFKEYPLNPDFLKWLRTDDNENINPYLFRDKASKTKVPLYELGRAFYHITQRRGFLSNRLDQSAEGILEEHCPRIQTSIEDLESTTEIIAELNEYFADLGILDNSVKDGFKKDLDDGEKKLKTLFNSLKAILKKNAPDLAVCKQELITRLNKKEDLGAVKGKISEISLAMKDGEFATLGQYFYSLYNHDKIRNQYTAREEHYLKEFEIICEIQSINGINRDEEIPEKRYYGLAKDLFKAIFFQRPLKSQKGLIGKCSFEPTKSRCAVSHPDFEEYRMWTYLNTIKFTARTEGNLRFLTQAEKQRLITKFLRKKDHFNFEELAKELVEKGASFGFYKSSQKENFDYWFNYRPTDSVSGCPVSASLKNAIGDDWKDRVFTYQTKNAKGLEVTRSVNYNDLWHLLSVSTSDLYLFEYAKNKLGLDEKNAKAFSKIRLKKDFGNLSLNAICKILPYLKEGLLYPHAVFMANLSHVVDDKIWNDPKQRTEIQNKIAKIIDLHTFENGLLETVNSLIKHCKTEETYYSKEAEPLYRIDLQNKLNPFFKKNAIEDEKTQHTILTDTFSIFIDQLKKFEFIKIKRLDEKVLEFLTGENGSGEIFCSVPAKLKNIYHPSDIDVFKKDIIKDEFGNETQVLGSPITQSIKNPMAMRALHQLRKVLNTLILEGRIDEKTHIHIEMARELNDANKRKAIQDYQNENKKFRDDAIKEIKKLYFEETKKEIEPTNDDLLRYQLWIEQNHKEIYEDGKNISISSIIGENPKYDIEHTIPRSISQDNSQMNKTLCTPEFNRIIKKQKMPSELENHEEIKLRVDHWRIEAEKLDEQIRQISRYIKNASTKEIKDKNIRKRHYLKLKHDYLKGKYDRFIWTEPKVGFKNSQIPDTGIITRYAQAYLKSYFKRVESVKGGMVAEFRKIWGIQESYQQNGKKYFKEKDRSKHTHHTIDAITIACMTKDKYDILAHAWTLEDKENITEARKVLADSKPWKTFKEDLIQIEEEILVSHYTPDNVKKQSKKIVRVRGKKQYLAEIGRDANGKAIPRKDARGKIIYKLNEHGEKIPRLQQGDTVRGSLHKDTNYGAIKINSEINYVLRKPVTKDFNENDVKNVVDEGIKGRINKHGLNNIRTKEGYLLLPEEFKGVNGATKNLKEMMIKKIRVFQSAVKNPLHLKSHSILSKSQKEYKNTVYAVNDENYAMAIYEDIDKKGKIKRGFELINYMQAGDYFKLSNRDFNKNYDLVPNPHDTNNLPLKYILKKGDLILFYQNEKEELKDFDDSILAKRLYKVIGFESDGRIQFRFHKTAMQQSSKSKEELTIVKFMADNNLKNSVIDFENPVPWLRLTMGNFNFIVNKIDFEFSATGKIIFNF